MITHNSLKKLSLVFILGLSVAMISCEKEPEYTCYTGYDGVEYCEPIRKPSDTSAPGMK